MSRSKPRKSKSKINNQQASLQPPPPLWWKERWKAIVGVAASFAALIGFASAVVTFLPRMQVDPEGPLDPSSPSPVSFTIANTGSIPLENVRALLGICSVGFNLTDKNPTPPTMCPRSLQSRMAPGKWNISRLGIDEKFAVTLEDPLNGQVGYADISIIVEYEPWFIPWRREKEFRFETRKLSDAKLHWFPHPLN
jgi:hypothetical protein